MTDLFANADMLQEKQEKDFIPPTSVNDDQASYTDVERVATMEI